MILIVLANTEVSGVARWVLDVARAVSSSDAVTVATFDDGGMLAADIRATGADVLRVTTKSAGRLRVALALYRSIRRLNPEVVHLTKISFSTLIVARLLRQRMHVEMSVHTFPSSWRGTLSHVLAPLACNAVVAVSPGVHRHLDRLLPKFLSEKVRYEPNFVSAPMSVRIGTALPVTRVGIVSRLTRNKGLDWATEVIRMTDSARVEFHIFGEGPLAADLREDLQGTEATVIWHGFETNLETLYGHMDYLLVCSADETFGLTLAEAAIRGIPLLVRDDYPYVRDLRLPILFSAKDDSRHMAQSISRLVMDHGWAPAGHRKNLHLRASADYSASRILIHFSVTPRRNR